MTRHPKTKGAPTPTAIRSRWPVLFSGLFLLWCAWWYGRADSQGLFYLSTVLTLLALVRARPLPHSTRWIVWGGVMLIILCLVANVSQLIPPDNAPYASRTSDRIITVVFAMGMTSLFFRPSTHAVTLVAITGLPMIMLTLSRAHLTLGSLDGYETLVVWGMLALLLAADLAQRLTAPRPMASFTPGLPELIRRFLCLVLVTGAAFWLRHPIECTAKTAQRWMFDWETHAHRQSRYRQTNLLLTGRTPLNFDRRMRLIMLVDARHRPGYLREAVFVHYQNGRWTALKPADPLTKTSSLLPEGQKNVFDLQPYPSKSPRVAWNVELLAPALLSGFCLPGNAITLAYDGPAPMSETNGMVTSALGFPEQYRIETTPSRSRLSAYPYPDGSAIPDYLQIPDALAVNVSNWVESCAGLDTHRAIAASITHVEDHFATNFTYRLGLSMQPTPDPLIDFMARKEGACTLFASAAALMFRSCGIPSRVISGYGCSEWNPWLKRWVVREREGHAWVEVFDRNSGTWLLVDPTPPDGNPAFLKKPGKGRLLLDMLHASWKRFLTFLSSANFLVVLADVGATLSLFLWQLIVSLPGAVVLAGFSALWWLRRRNRRPILNTEARLRQQMTHAMQRIANHAVATHLRRRASEPWSVWFQRIEPELPAATSETLCEWLTSYQENRYRAQLDIPAAHAWLALAHKKR